jgi:hypothetical protein
MSIRIMHHAGLRGRSIVPLLVALSSSTVAGAQRGSTQPTSVSRPPVPLRTRWPSTTAIAIIERNNPVAVEATSDGWVVLTPVGPWLEPYNQKPTPTQVQLAPSSVRQWTREVRAALALASDSARKKSPQPQMPQLGHGYARFSGGWQVRATDRTFLNFQRCDGASSSWSLTPADLASLVAALDRAASVAEQGSSRPVPPTLDRPYYSSEVSCTAEARPGNTPARFPSAIPASQRRYTDVGVRFIVDTSGFVEAGSVTTLPGASPPLDSATRELVARWRFRPAVRGGAPVRQVVSTAVTYDPSRPDLPALPRRVPAPYMAPGYGVNAMAYRDDLVPQRTYLDSGDGWVHLRVGTWNRTGAFSGVQEWFSPDSVEAWAARAQAFVTVDSARARQPRTAIPAAVLGHPLGNAFEVRYLASSGPDTMKAPWAFLRGCGSGLHAEAFDRSLVERFVAAARAARAERATPREPGDSVFARGEVACPAFLRDVHALQEELNAFRPPRAPVPSSMETLHARAEVLTSFVVDTSGAPLPSTLVAMPGSDPRAVAALRAQLNRYRFEPATRSGVPVNALVIRNWSFEPRPFCRDTYDGLDCARVYSKTSER